MPDEAFDVAVIGGGSAGYVGAIRGAQLGLKVAVIEKEKVGGTCLHRGCIPTKSFLHSSELAHQLHSAGALGLKTDGLQIDWPAVLKRKEAVVNQLWRGVEFLLKKNKVTVFKGEGTIESEHKVVVKGSGEAISARNLVVATGSRPKSLAGLTMDGDRVINSDHAVNLEQMPKSIVIVGAGDHRSEEHTSELQSHSDLVCRLLLEKKKKKYIFINKIIIKINNKIKNSIRLFYLYK